MTVQELINNLEQVKAFNPLYGSRNVVVRLADETKASVQGVMYINDLSDVELGLTIQGCGFTPESPLLEGTSAWEPRMLAIENAMHDLLKGKTNV